MTTPPPPQTLAPADQPSVLFVCVHNAGRSQMAAGYLREFSQGRIEVRSAFGGFSQIHVAVCP